MAILSPQRFRDVSIGANVDMTSISDLVETRKTGFEPSRL
jgi:hypothetical protein